MVVVDVEGAEVCAVSDFRWDPREHVVLTKFKTPNYFVPPDNTKNNTKSKETDHKKKWDRPKYEAQQINVTINLNFQSNKQCRGRCPPCC